MGFIREDGGGAGSMIGSGGWTRGRRELGVRELLRGKGGLCLRGLLEAAQMGPPAAESGNLPWGDGWGHGSTAADVGWQGRRPVAAAASGGGRCGGMWWPAGAVARGGLEGAAAAAHLPAGGGR